MYLLTIGCPLESLVDTGAWDRNYESRELGERILSMDAHKHPCDIPATSGCNATVFLPCQGIVDFDMQLPCQGIVDFDHAML